MSKQYDIVVAGGGHQGLVAAGYLAKAGLNVCVVERREYVGGGAITREVTGPGFKQDLNSICHTFIQANPLIKDDELKLISKHGLKYINPKPEENTCLWVFPDGRSLGTHMKIEKTCESIEKFSRKDAESYYKFHQYSMRIAPLMTQSMFAPTPGFGQLISVLENMGAEGQDLLRIMLMSARELADEWFESDEMKISFARMVHEALAPFGEKGTAFIPLMYIPWMEIYGIAFPEGGSGVLTQKLAECIKALGGTIRTSSLIKSFKIEDGKAKGVVLDTGEEITAKKAVISGLSVKQNFLQMVDEKWLPEGFRPRVKRLKHSVCSGLNTLYALNNPPHWKIDAANRTAMVFCCHSNSLKDYLKMEEDFAAGIYHTGSISVLLPSVWDPTRAPAGKHTMYLFHLVPYQLQGGTARWNEVREKAADDILHVLREKTTNMGNENIIARFIETPVDIEANNPAMENGDYFGIGTTLEQNFALRPLPGWGNYRTPVGKLYMCGPCTFPGGAVNGGSGRAVSMVLMEDLGINFDKVVR